MLLSSVDHEIKEIISLEKNSKLVTVKKNVSIWYKFYTRKI